jgi:hypothetical protein
MPTEVLLAEADEGYGEGGEGDRFGQLLSLLGLLDEGTSGDEDADEGQKIG